MEQSCLPRVKLRENRIGTECYINDQKIERVTSVDFRAAVDEVSTFDFEMSGMPDIDMFGNIQFSFAPETVKEAIIVLRNELMKHGDLYNGFLSSIKSALDDYGYEAFCLEDGNIEVAYEVLRRMIGEDGN